MSYVAPDPSALVVDFSQQAPYTAPDPSNLQVSWLPLDVIWSGQVINPDPTQVGVLIYDWTTRAMVDLLSPGPDGVWSRVMDPGIYGITYQRTGYAPVTHGPYRVLM